MFYHTIISFQCSGYGFHFNVQSMGFYIEITHAATTEKHNSIVCRSLGMERIIKTTSRITFVMVAQNTYMHAENVLMNPFR